MKTRDPGDFMMGLIFGLVIGVSLVLAFQWELGLPWGGK